MSSAHTGDRTGVYYYSRGLQGVGIQSCYCTGVGGGPCSWSTDSSRTLAEFSDSYSFL